MVAPGTKHKYRCLLPSAHCHSKYCTQYSSASLLLLKNCVFRHKGLLFTEEQMELAQGILTLRRLRVGGLGGSVHTTRGSRLSQESEEGEVKDSPLLMIHTIVFKTNVIKSRTMT